MEAALLKQLTLFANQDLAMARQSGVMVVADTLYGAVQVAYTEGTYTLTSTDGTVLAQGKASVAVGFLVEAYDVYMGN